MSDGRQTELCARLHRSSSGGGSLLNDNGTFESAVHPRLVSLTSALPLEVFTAHTALEHLSRVHFAHMSREIGLSLEGVGALRTTVCTNTRVNRGLVFTQIRAVGEGLRALSALIRFESRVNALVFSEMSALSECLRAVRALERLHVRVRQLVLAQSRACSGGVGALGARERALTGVSPHVIDEAALLHEGLLAVFTLEWFFAGVNSQVLGEGALLCKGFVALCALEWAFTRVHTRVSSEGARTRERLRGHPGPGLRGGLRTAAGRRPGPADRG